MILRSFAAKAIQNLAKERRGIFFRARFDASEIGGFKGEDVLGWQRLQRLLRHTCSCIG
jgi:hypothetical protein